MLYFGLILLIFGRRFGRAGLAFVYLLLVILLEFFVYHFLAPERLVRVGIELGWDLLEFFVGTCTVSGVYGR